MTNEIAGTRLIQNLNEMLDQIDSEGIIDRTDVHSEFEDGKLIISYVPAGSEISVRSKDSIKMREEKLKNYFLPIVQRVKEMQREKDALVQETQKKLKEKIVQTAQTAREVIQKSVESGNIVYSDTDSTIRGEPIIPDGHIYVETVLIREEGEISFELVVTTKDGDTSGKKFYTCPCGQTYNQKGHAKWNHIDRHLNRKK